MIHIVEFRYRIEDLMFAVRFAFDMTGQEARLSGEGEAQTEILALGAVDIQMTI